MRVAMLLTLLVLLVLLSLITSPNTLVAEATPTIPAHNAASLIEPPPLPAIGDFDGRARALFDAIIHDDPARAADAFLPRAAFALIKAVPQPDRLYDRLFRAYERDIHTLHTSISQIEQATFVRVELSRRREFVKRGGEGNRLTYWAQRHNHLVYRLGNREQRIELRVLITWDDKWYLTHLSEFH